MRRLASKGALIALTRTMAREAGEHGDLIAGQTLIVDGGRQVL
jgi:hypothetical protein